MPFLMEGEEFERVPAMQFCMNACFPQVPTVEAVLHILGFEESKEERQMLEACEANGDSYAVNAKAAAQHMKAHHFGFRTLVASDPETRRFYAFTTLMHMALKMAHQMAPSIKGTFRSAELEAALFGAAEKSGSWSWDRIKVQSILGDFQRWVVDGKPSNPEHKKIERELEDVARELMDEFPRMDD